MTLKIKNESSDGQCYLINTLSYKENVLEGIEIYPNPVTKEITFHNLEAESDIYCFDNTGRLVLKTKVTTSNNKVDVSDFSQDAYSVLI